VFTKRSVEAIKLFNERITPCDRDLYNTCYAGFVLWEDEFGLGSMLVEMFAIRY